ncbi:DNA polymerase I [Rhodopirellula sp. MGV]|uniref:DNA polymerase I n=1 Tax=Rhodopirellula sp. MGV TaxID=2023130 RepID=UPI000B96C4F3|nr:DNA polymerase I [Rhodopirellula sp. MGV]OYP38293.1 DNA polymerase I [Rhodopirellula sp. MGV]PNY38884.1 DNA polymerase I [Rhodopirellula baltica]
MANETQDLFAPSKKLYLLDGMALLYRAHFALIRSPRFTSGGQCTSAVFGMLNTVTDILTKHEPTHIAFAFDTSEPTERHKAFPEYKAHRDAMPEDLASQIPLVDRLLEALNITVIRMPGYEADDVIGTLAHQAQAEGFETWMVTPDKDYHQLVTDQIHVYKPGSKGGQAEVLGVDEVCKLWEIDRVTQVIDVLGLMGDASDNIPGVPGIGPKTAKKLVSEFGSVEGLLDNVDKLKGKQKERVAENREQALLSKKLVTIQLDVPTEVDLESLRCKGNDEAKLRELLVDLEFETVGKRLFGNSFSAASARTAVVQEKRKSEIQQSLFDEPANQKTLADVTKTYHTVTTKKARTDLIKQLRKADAFCFDTEATGLDPRTAEPLGIAISLRPHEAYYVVCPSDPDERQAMLEEFADVLSDPKITKIGHNLKYDVSLLRWQGIKVAPPLFDTMLVHTIAEPEMPHGMDALCELYLNYKPIPTSDLIGPKGKEQKSMADVPLEQLAEYACEDADVTLQLAEVLRTVMEENEVQQVCNDVECPLVPVLVEMEFNGITLDTESLGKYAELLQTEIDDLQTKIYAAAQHEFNIDSPKQLGVVLFEELKLEEKPKKTATGQYSTREAELERLSGKHEIIRDVLDYRNARKLKSTYVDQLPGAVNPETGRLHTHYSQTWTATGRLQSNDPNLQTIPVRKERGREIRAAFVPRSEDHLILSADYSQIELRIMAELSQDEAMMSAFINNEDIHTVTASKVYKVDPDDVTREMRAKAKTVNFGIIYGISAFGLQQRLNIPRAEASDLINNYFEKYPGVQRYIDSTIEFAQEHGFVKTKTGRRRFVRDITSRSRNSKAAAERLAMNSPIQGTAADMLKLAMINVADGLKAGGFETKMLLTVHDELVFDMLKSEADQVMPVIEAAMKNALPMEVPILVEMGTGKNWLEAH